MLGTIGEQSAKLLYREIDYAQEGANAQVFKESFAGTPWVKVPNVSIILEVCYTYSAMTALIGNSYSYYSSKCCCCSCHCC
jgi:ABC1 atypical kinase-like domain